MHPEGQLEERVTRESLSEAFHAFADEIFAFCSRRCDDRAVAEDLVSVVFLEAWRCRERAILRDGSLRPWLYGIAANVVRNANRSVRRHHAALRRYHLENGDVRSADHAEWMAASAADRQALQQAFASLSKKDRVVADLCLVEQLSAADVAAVLDLPEGTVKSRLAHARAGLRAVLRSSELPGLVDPLAGERTLNGEHASCAPEGEAVMVDGAR